MKMGIEEVDLLLNKRHLPGSDRHNSFRNKCFGWELPSFENFFQFPTSFCSINWGHARIPEYKRSYRKLESFIPKSIYSNLPWTEWVIWVQVKENLVNIRNSRNSFCACKSGYKDQNHIYHREPSCTTQWDQFYNSNLSFSRRRNTTSIITAQ